MIMLLLNSFNFSKKKQQIELAKKAFWIKWILNKVSIGYRFWHAHDFSIYIIEKSL